MAKKKQAIIYGRKSREMQETLESQINACIEWCIRNDVEFDVLSEEGSASSEDWNRPKLQEMITRLKNLEYDLVVVTEQTRICRDDMFPIFKQILLDNQILFVTADNNSIFDFSNPDDELKSDILQAVGKNELSRTKIRLKRGTVQSAKKGNWVGKKCPVGYNYNKSTKRLEPNDDALIILKMFELYLEGLSTKEIAYKFTLENVKTTNNIIWTPSGVSRLLNNIVYIGHSLYGRTTQKKKNGKRETKQTNKSDQILIENTHEAIITQDIFNEVQRIKLLRNSRPISLKLAKHKFSGLIHCGICGATHSFQTAHRKKRISSCQTRHYQHGSLVNYRVCENKGIYLDDFEHLFFELLRMQIDQLERNIELINAKEQPKRESNVEKIKSYENQLRKIDQDIKRVQRGFSLEIYTEEEAQKEIKGYRLQKENIERDLLKLSTELNEENTSYQEKLLKRMKDFYNGHSNMPEAKANEELKVFISGIIYKKTDEMDGEMELQIIPK